MHGFTADGRRFNVAVPYSADSFEVVNEAWRLARETLAFKLQALAEFEASSGLWACCQAEIAGCRHIETCAAAHPDGTAR